MSESETATDVVFVEGAGPVKAPSTVSAAIKAAQAAATVTTVRVKVLAPYRVCHQGVAYVGGQTVTVPAAVANRWLADRSVELAPARPKPVSQKES